MLFCGRLFFPNSPPVTTNRYELLSPIVKKRGGKLLCIANRPGSLPEGLEYGIEKGEIESVKKGDKEKKESYFISVVEEEEKVDRSSSLIRTAFQETFGGGGNGGGGEEKKGKGEFELMDPLSFCV